MDKIATTQELQHELQRLLNYAQSHRPSRETLAQRLARLSHRVAGDTFDIDAAKDYNLRLAKLLQKLKRDAGAKFVVGNYKGTGSKRHRRQIFVRFTNDLSIDLWLEDDNVSFAGVSQRGVQGPNGFVKEIPYGGRTPEEVYKDVAGVLAYWAANTQPPAWAGNLPTPT